MSVTVAGSFMFIEIRISNHLKQDWIESRHSGHLVVISAYSSLGYLSVL
jgi:hypothetical protein